MNRTDGPAYLCWTTQCGVCIDCQVSIDAGHPLSAAASMTTALQARATLVRRQGKLLGVAANMLPQSLLPDC